MRPVRLVLQAFGPFAAREQVDFAALPQDALFLIHGPTGAGKTTLLDGICYALYGSTSGDERQAKEMRSHHAADSVPTEVELEFELGGKRYLVRRSPEQERAALRGKGSVKVQGKAELHLRDGDGWTVLAARPTEVNERIVGLLGFEADQFRQVIMLPQGQFRRLLSADSRERERILEALFSTEKYKQLQARLQDSARALERRADEEKQKREALLGQAGLDSAEALDSRIAEIGLALEGMDPVLKQARETADAAAKAVSAGEALAGKFAEREQARQALLSLQQNDEAVLEQRKRLERATVARQIEPSWEMLNQAANQYSECLKRVEAGNAAAATAEAAYRESEARLNAETAKEKEREDARRRLTLLEEQRAGVARLEDAKKAMQETATAHQTAHKRMEGHEQQAAALARKRQELHAETERLAPLAGRSDAIRLETEKQEKRLRMAVDVENTRADLNKTNAAFVVSARKLETAQASVTAARRKRDRLHEAWRMGQAAVLARHLHDGEECPVCGSYVHPRPAQEMADIPSDEALTAVADELDAVEAACDRLRNSHSAMDLARGQHATALKTLLETLALDDAGEQEDASIAGRKTRLDALREEGKQSANAAAGLEQARRQLKECEEAIVENDRHLATARTDAAQAQATAQGARSGFDALAATIPEAMRSRDALERAIREASATSAAFDRALKAAQQAFDATATTRAAAAARLQAEREALDAAASRKDNAQRAFDAALARTEIADRDAFIAARMEPETMAAMARRIQEHDQSLAAARERSARAEEAVRELQTPDLNALRMALQEAHKAVESVVERQGVLQQQLANARKTSELLAAVRGRLEQVEKEYRVMGELAGVASGRNGANMTFQRYVLAALLDDVLRQASLRLKIMSRSRYSLQRSGGVSDGRKAAGLDLDVLDDYTGRSRPANTLSGGEGFMASLSLALGLSDVVQTYAGGVQLDTLFIDEGFGTLDPESLDMAMKTLIDLQQKGRLVGIISHVDELKRQIDNGIEVRFAASGSTIRVGKAIPN